MTYPNLSFTLYRDLLVPFIPLQEQRQIAQFLQAFFEWRPLPGLPRYLSKERRIVAGIEELSAKIEEARTLHEGAVDEVAAMLSAARNRLIGATPQPDWIPLSTYVKEIENGWSPAAESRRAEGDEWAIVENLDGVQARSGSLKKLQHVTSEELDALMPSILSKAFAGEL